MRELRALLRHRVVLVRLGTSAKNRIHAVLADHGLDREQGLWSGAGRAWLAELRLPATARLIVDDHLALIDSLAAPIAAVQAQIAARTKPDPRVKVLTALPGVGQLTAMTLLAEIGDVTRFRTARKLCAWAGLTPTVRNSDRRVRHGHITKAGPPWVRWILPEAAQRAKRDPEFAGAYAAIAHRRGKHIATVAIARKLLARAFHRLTEQAEATAQATTPASAALPTQPAKTPRAQRPLPTPATPTTTPTTSTKDRDTNRMVTSTGRARVSA